MSIQELLGWANSIIAQYGLDQFIKAAIVIFLASSIILRFVGRKSD